MSLFAHKLSLLRRLGVTVEKSAGILDFGCGEGTMVYEILAKGYDNVQGFDVIDSLKLQRNEDRSRFAIDRSGQLPYKDRTFDLIVSDQVFEHVSNQEQSFRELYRILKPGGHAVHIFPAKYQLIEPHIYVPLGGIIGEPWYYKFWASMGVRNGFQQGLTARQTAAANVKSFRENLNYVPNSQYKQMWKTIGYEFKDAEQLYMETSENARIRKLGALSRTAPGILWAIRTFWVRIVYMHKPSS
jgi:SAM-dependent methyltransferase